VHSVSESAERKQFDEEPCTWHSPESAEICILAVDDQPENLIALNAALRHSSYRLITAESGAEALTKVLKYEFAAILMDIQMPEMDGFETARQIRSHEKVRHTPIIFLTAFGNDEHHIKRGYEAGAVDYLYKPLNVSILKAKLEVFAELFRKTKELEYQANLWRSRDRMDKDRQIAQLKQDTQKQYRDLVEGIRNGIVWTADAETLNFSFVSPHAEMIMGYPLSRWLDDSAFIWDRVHDDDQELLRVAIEDAKESRADVEVEHRMARADGTWLWFNTNIRFSNSARGLELRGLCVDVSRLKETEKSLRDMLKMRDEFLSIASHELKTPLTPLQLQVESFLRLFKQGRLKSVPDHILEQLLGTSHAQVSIMSRLVDQLLDVSRITSGKLQLTRGQTDLVGCVQDVVQMFKDELSTKDIEIRLDLPEHLYGFWDQSRLEQIVMNLLNNAIKYGEGNPIKIAVKWERKDRASLIVEDSGIGISSLDHVRIFERFERAVSPSNFSGLGLGLYITKRLVDLHGGKISIDSEVGRGTIFRIDLPLSMNESVD
jgi:PAS domain S-box-containing protein